jgi:hypothetical protein
MLRISDQRNFTRTLAGLSLIVAPLLLLLSTLVGPDLSDDGTKRLSEIARNDGRYVASHYLLLVGAWVFVPALLGLSRLFRGPRVTLGQLGAGLLLIGWISTVAYFGLGTYEYEASRSNLDRDLMGNLVESANDSVIMVPMIIITFLIGIAIGSLIVAWSLWRRKLAPSWAAAALVVWTILDIMANNVTVSAIALAFLLVGFGSVGHKLLSMTDEEWDVLGRATGQAETSPSPDG